MYIKFAISYGCFNIIGEDLEPTPLIEITKKKGYNLYKRKL